MHQILGVKGLGYGWVLCVFFNKATQSDHTKSNIQILQCSLNF